MVTYEGGLRPHRLWFAREDTEGVVPSDPEWMLYSDVVNGFDPELDPGVDPQMALGSPDPQAFFAGTMGATVTVAYDLQQKSGSGDTFVDGSGDPTDAATDGFLRDTDNEILDTHTIVRRMTQSDIKPGNTVNGSTSKDTRQYMVFNGAHPDPTLVHDPSEATPVGIELEYTCTKAEVYQVDQPDGSTTIDVVSGNANDGGQVTIEDEGGSTSETLAITADGRSTTTASFSDIDAVMLDAEQPGDITIAETGGDDLMVISGMESYDHGEGDRGVPAIEAGSTPTSINERWETPVGTEIERPNGVSFSEEVMTVDVAANNNFTDDARTDGPRPLVVAEGREATADVTFTGETEYKDKISDALQTALDDFEYELDGGAVTLEDMAVLEASHSEDPEQGYFEIDASLRGQGVTLS
jgi:hypothetical protein